MLFCVTLAEIRKSEDGLSAEKTEMNYATISGYSSHQPDGVKESKGIRRCPLAQGATGRLRKHTVGQDKETARRCRSSVISAKIRPGISTEVMPRGQIKDFRTTVSRN